MKQCSNTEDGNRYGKMRKVFQISLNSKGLLPGLLSLSDVGHVMLHFKLASLSDGNPGSNYHGNLRTTPNDLWCLHGHFYMAS